MTLALGGPGVACSALRIRRLLAGELEGEERSRTADHLAVCARCQETDRTASRERARLAVDLPFEDFASGVAERLVRPPGRARTRRAAGLALAAGLAIAVAIPGVLRLVGGREDGWRLKGSGEIAVYVSAPGGARPLAPGEPVPAGSALRLGLPPEGGGFAAVALLDADGVTILHEGAVERGVLPGAFEWTGAGDGTLVAVVDGAPVDGEALARRLRRGGLAAASPGGRAVVLLRPIRRGAP